MTNLMSMAKGRFKKSKKKSSTNNMKKKGRKSKSRSSSSSGEGKVLGVKIPIIGKVFGNKTVRKALMGAGAVSLAVSIAALINNPTINKAISNKLVRVGLATASGDIVGGAVQFLKESPQVLSRRSNGGGTQTSLVSMAGNGVA